MDFGSKEVSVTTHDIREETITFTREELGLASAGSRAGVDAGQRESNPEVG